MNSDVEIKGHGNLVNHYFSPPTHSSAPFPDFELLLRFIYLFIFELYMVDHILIYEHMFAHSSNGIYGSLVLLTEFRSWTKASFLLLWEFYLHAEPQERVGHSQPVHAAPFTCNPTRSAHTP